MANRRKPVRSSEDEQDWSDRTSNDEAQDSDYEVERVLVDAERDDGETVYLVKWLSYPDYWYADFAIPWSSFASSQMYASIYPDQDIHTSRASIVEIGAA